MVNVANGSAGTDAVNLSQLDAAVAGVVAGTSPYIAINSSSGPAMADGSEGIAIGGDSVSAEDNSVAIGNSAVANAAGSVAIGAGSVADQANSVSFGAAGSERRLVNVADGTADTDAVNLGQLNAVAAIANESAAQNAAQNTAIQEAQADADEALAQNLVQDAAISAIDSKNIAQDAVLANQETLITNNTQLATTALDQNVMQDTAISANNAAANLALSQNVQQNLQMQAVSDLANGALAQNLVQDGRLDQLELGLASMSGALDQVNRDANGGIAAAVALGGTYMPPDSNFAVNFNLATYRGEQGFAGSLVGRVSERVYVTGGVAGSTRRGGTTGRVGLAIGF